MAEILILVVLCVGFAGIGYTLGKSNGFWTGWNVGYESGYKAAVEYIKEGIKGVNS